jgi:hypothetical protein
MNERFKELAVQSDLWRMLEEYSWEFGSCDPEKDCGRIEKFAELIVRECMNVAVYKSDGMIFTADIAGHQAAGREIAAKMIKQHFGVE